MPSVKTKIGTFSFDGVAWVSDAETNSVTILWVASELDLGAIEQSTTVVQELNSFTARAKCYAQTNGANVWDCTSTLTLKSLDITEILNGGFCLTFGVESDPDFTVSVEFVDGEPHDVWGAH